MNKEQWDQFIIENNGCFLQSWQWGEFQATLCRQIWRIEKDNLKGLIVQHNLPLGKNYLYCPRGPIVANQIADYQLGLKSFLEEIREVARQEGSIFLKIEPPLGLSLAGLGLMKVKKEIQPSQTLLLDITKPSTELLSQMHKKTRYSIRLAKRKGVVVEKISQIHSSMIEIFLQLLKKTAQRDKFYLHPPVYYHRMMEVLTQDGTLKLFLAKYQNQVIAANLVCFFGTTAYYLHGASNYQFRHLMAPHLLQWKAILEAKKIGCHYYDFWGIHPEKWPGVTKFKIRFGGERVVYDGAFDWVFRTLWYRVYNLARHLF